MSLKCPGPLMLPPNRCYRDLPVRAWLTAVAFLLGLAAFPASAEWFARADFSSCPRQYVPQTSGGEGPFSSKSACSARIAEVQSQSPMACARYWCDEGGSGGSTGALPAVPTGATPQQTLALGAAALGGYMLGSAIREMLTESPKED